MPGQGVGGWGGLVAMLAGEPGEARQVARLDVRHHVLPVDAGMVAGRLAALVPVVQGVFGQEAFDGLVPI